MQTKFLYDKKYNRLMSMYDIAAGSWPSSIKNFTSSFSLNFVDGKQAWDVFVVCHKSHEIADKKASKA